MYCSMMYLLIRYRNSITILLLYFQAKAKKEAEEKALADEKKRLDDEKKAAEEKAEKEVWVIDLFNESLLIV